MKFALRAPVVYCRSLLGIAVIPIMSSVFASIRTSSVARSAAQVETAVVNAADRVNRAPRTCDYTPYVQAAVQTQGWDPSTASVVHERLQTPTDATATAVWVPGACLNDPILTDLEVQRVTISISSPDGRVTRSIQVVKSDV
ncbi:MAG: hypothetical protein MUE78_11780 [Ilumatobacteraceae bacterium]|nr:hypothetical protein [Ilumatobacteraceae bacterium]